MTFSSVGSSISYNPRVDHLHVVKEGETMDSLAGSHGVTNVAEMLSANPGSRFEAGDLVVIQLKRSLRS